MEKYRKIFVNAFENSLEWHLNSAIFDLVERLKLPILCLIIVPNSISPNLTFYFSMIFIFPIDEATYYVASISSLSSICVVYVALSGVGLW